MAPARQMPTVALHLWLLLLICNTFNCLVQINRKSVESNDVFYETFVTNSLGISKVIDFNTRAIAYKDQVLKRCYVERINGQQLDEIRHLRVYRKPLTREEILRIGGPTIASACFGWLTRVLVEPDKLRRKRSNGNYFATRPRGQTQSQYLSYGKGGSNDPSGKAEAEATIEGSKAVVAGSNGMGQAQSQSYPFSCQDCLHTQTGLSRPDSGDSQSQFTSPGIGQTMDSRGRQQGFLTDTGDQYGGRRPGEGAYPGSQSIGAQSQRGDLGSGQQFPGQPGQPGMAQMGPDRYPGQISPLGPPGSQPGQFQIPGQLGQHGYPGSTGVPQTTDTKYPGLPYVPQSGQAGQMGLPGQTGGIQSPGYQQRPGIPGISSTAPGEISQTTDSRPGSIRPPYQPGQPTSLTHPSFGQQPGQIGYPSQPGTPVQMPGQGYGPQPGEIRYGQPPTQIGVIGLPSPMQQPTFGQAGRQPSGPSPMQQPTYEQAGPQPSLPTTMQQPTFGQGGRQPSGMDSSGHPLRQPVQPSGLRPGPQTTGPSGFPAPGIPAQTGGQPGTQYAPGSVITEQPGYPGSIGTISYPGQSGIQDIGRPGEISLPAGTRPAGTRPAVGPDFGQPGASGLYGQQGVGVRPGDPTAGTFMGHITGNYQSHVGQQGEFTGSFHGQYSDQKHKQPGTIQTSGQNVMDGGHISGPSSLQQPWTSVGAPSAPGQRPIITSATDGRYAARPGIVPGPYGPSQQPIYPGGSRHFGTQGQPGEYPQARPGISGAQAFAPGQMKPGDSSYVPSSLGTQDLTAQGRLPGGQPGSIGQIGPAQVPTGQTLGQRPDQLSLYPDRQYPGQGILPGAQGGDRFITRPVGAIPGSAPGGHVSFPSAQVPAVGGQVGGQVQPGVSGIDRSGQNVIPGFGQGPQILGPTGQPIDSRGQIGPQQVMGPDGRLWPAQMPGSQILSPGLQPGVAPANIATGQMGSPSYGVQIPGSVGIGTTGVEVPSTGARGQIPIGSPPYWTGIPGTPAPALGSSSVGIDGQQFQPQYSGPGGQGYITQPGSALTGSLGGVNYALSPPDDSDTQAQSSIQQISNGTQASASAQGLYQRGTAQSQVSGTYSGQGSFSASAGSNDGLRGAQTQVAGGSEGAMSSAQGSGGKAQSQSQVQLNSETGGTTSGAQSGGINHGTLTQVQAGIKGGMADSQANGPGSTSSQAQIGFTPPHAEDSDQPGQGGIFGGGGSASASGGSRAGRSQAQINGKYEYGIRYIGSAQAQSSNDGITTGNYTLPKLKPISFDFNKRGPQEDSFKVTNVREVPKTDEMRILTITPSTTQRTQRTTTEDDYGDEEYDDEDDYNETPAPVKNQKRTRNLIEQEAQQRYLNPLENAENYEPFPLTIPTVLKSGTVESGMVVPGSQGFRIPTGFRGRVTNQEGIQPKNLLFAAGANANRRSESLNYGSGYTFQPVEYGLKQGKPHPKFFSVTKSESGSKNLLTGKKVPSVYYTQSSSCGYFTNSCFYSNGKKICMPKPKTNPDGTPIIC